MRKTTFSLLLVISTLTFKLHAQVTIGSGEKPAYGALLELKTQQAGTVTNVEDDANITSTNGGLLLPRVKLNILDMSSLNTVMTNGDALPNEDKLKLAGLMVYNIEQIPNQLYLGVYVWNGSTWTYLTDSKTSSPMAILNQPKSFSFYETGLETPEALKFEVIPPKAVDGTQGTVAYQWYKIVGNNLHARVGEAIAGETNSTYIPTVAFKTINGSKSTLYAQNNGLTRFYCEVIGNDGSKLQSDIAEVAVGCGAKNNLGEWISFMCFNLGAENGITIQQQKEYPIGEFTNEGDGTHTYIPNEEKVWGDLYQWGRIADGHQNRQSLIKEIGDGVDLKNNIGSGYYCTRNGAGNVYGNPYPYYQVKTGTDWYSKFITSTFTHNYNWYPQAASVTNCIDQLWRNGRFVSNDPCAKYKVDGTMVEAWTNQDVPVGANTNNPSPACIESNTSWRTPTQDDWAAIFKGGFTSGHYSAATANTWTWYNGTETNYSRGYEIKPDGITTTLFLPATGHRNAGNGLLYNQGYNANYWSSSIMSTNAYYLYYNSTTVSPANTLTRAYGFALRCIKN